MSRYQKQKTREISFPLGGIGSGCIGLAGNGQLIDWEIFNHPDKGKYNGYSHFAIKVEKEGELVDARVLHGDYLGALSGISRTDDRLRKKHSGFGVGPDCETLAGMPHFADTTFDGEFPQAQIRFSDPSFPGDVQLLAFNPFIPGNEDDSSLPVAWFEWEITNTSHARLDYTLCLSLHNGLAHGQTHNGYQQHDGLHSINLSQSRWPENDPRYAELVMATDTPEVSYQEYWYRGSWFDSLSLFWHDFCSSHHFTNRTYHQPQATGQDCSSLAAHLSLDPGEVRQVRFIIGWYAPVNYNYWRRWSDHETLELLHYSDYQQQTTWRNYYATQFSDALSVVKYTFDQAERLLSQTQRFQQALHSSSVPASAMDAIAANLSVLKSPTCLRLEDGSLYGWEGSLNDIGACEGSCIHVWNYVQSLPFLFPRLERSMRDLNQRYNLRDSGSLRFRLMIPFDNKPFDFRACADGQFGEIINIYRDWLICGDHQWLRQKFPAIKSMLAFAWSDENEDRWDPTQSGILTGRQHHTLDMELFGANPWLSGLYLAALKAAAVIATELGYEEEADLWSTIFKRGQDYLNHHLFNGEYYQHKIDISDRSLLAPYCQQNELSWNNDTGNVYDFYWSDEQQEIKYQIGDGCHIDQVMGQWFADLCQLGDIFAPEKVRSALASIYRHNFLTRRNHINPCRIFSLNDEQGVSICSWPKAGKPRIPLPYAQETMTGFEYQVAAQMISCGMLAEGDAITSAIRQRFDGEKRNPWNEFECGSNYARSMASYGLLLAWSGFRYDMPRKAIGFFPANSALQQHHYFWSLGTAWGTVSITPESCELRLLYGEIELNHFAFPQTARITAVIAAQEDCGWSLSGNELSFEKPLCLTAEQFLTVKY